MLENDDLAAEGWLRTARVDFDAFFQIVDQDDRPAQQACSIVAVRGTLARVRCLLFDVQPTPAPPEYHAPPNHTFFEETDVHVAP